MPRLEPESGSAVALEVPRGLNGSAVASRAHCSGLSQPLAMKSPNVELGRPRTTPCSMASSYCYYFFRQRNCFLDNLASGTQAAKQRRVCWSGNGWPGILPGAEGLLCLPPTQGRPQSASTAGALRACSQSQRLHSQMEELYPSGELATCCHDTLNMPGGGYDFTCLIGSDPPNHLLR